MEFSAVNRRRPSRETPLGARSKEGRLFSQATTNCPWVSADDSKETMWNDDSSYLADAISYECHVLLDL